MTSAHTQGRPCKGSGLRRGKEPRDPLRWAANVAIDQALKAAHVIRQAWPRVDTDTQQDLLG